METAYPGSLIVIDGIAGSGKSTLIKSVKAHAQEQGKRVFDLSEWIKDHDEPPKLDEVLGYDLYFTFEPTKQWVGAAIRFEMSRTDDPYQATSLAQAFSLDRLIQYRRLIIPLLKRGATIIQDRSVSTSIVIQPTMKNGPELEYLLELPGNKLALKYAPKHLILTDIPPEKTVERIQNRTDHSKGVFEQLELLKRIDQRYKSPWFQELFTKRGTNIHTFSTDQEQETMTASFIRLIDTLI